MEYRTITAGAVAVALATVLVACNGESATGSGDTGGADATSSTAVTSGSGGAPAVTQLSDGQIVGVLEASNQAEIAVSTVAAGRVLDPLTRAYANEMIDDHKAAKQALHALINDARLMNKTSEQAEHIAAVAENSMAQIAAYPIDDVDKLYVDSQIVAHGSLLDLIDSEVMADVNDESLKNFMAETRKMVEAHFVDAQELKERLDGVHQP